MNKASLLVRNLLRANEIPFPEPVKDTDIVMVKVKRVTQDGVSRNIATILTKKRFEHLVSKGATPEQIFRNECYANQFQEISFGKILNNLYPSIDCDLRKKIVLSFEEEVKSEDQFFALLPGKVAYLTSVSHGGGTLGSSCMRNSPKADYYNAVAKGILCLFNQAVPSGTSLTTEKDILGFKSPNATPLRIAGRCVLWSALYKGKPTTVMDRIYTHNENDLRQFFTYASSHGIWCKVVQGAGIGDFVLERGGKKLTCKSHEFLIPVQKEPFLGAVRKGVPYLDTFSRVLEDSSKRKFYLSGSPTYSKSDKNDLLHIASLSSGGISFTGEKNCLVDVCNACKRNSFSTPHLKLLTVLLEGEKDEKTYCTECVVKDYREKYIPRNKSVNAIVDFDKDGKPILGLTYSEATVSTEFGIVLKSLTGTYEDLAIDEFSGEKLFHTLFTVKNKIAYCEEHKNNYHVDKGCVLCKCRDLITCSVCGRTVSNVEASCPHCGAMAGSSGEDNLYIVPEGKAIWSYSELTKHLASANENKMKSFVSFITVPKNLDDSFKDHILSMESCDKGVKITRQWLNTSTRRLSYKIKSGNKITHHIGTAFFPDFNIDATSGVTSLFLKGEEADTNTIKASTNKEKETILEVGEIYRKALLKDIQSVIDGKLTPSSFIDKMFAIFI